MARAGLGLKLLQWFIRGIQFGCCALIFAIYCYFLATLANHDLTISNHIRAVTGITGAGSLYTIVGLALLCCLAGHVITSAIAIFLDLCFAAAFIYVAWANRNGASSCNGYLDTPYGQGNANRIVDGNSNAFTRLPSLRSACRMQTACFAVAIVAIFFFLFSILVEVFLVRNRKKERRFGPGPNNGYTSGSGTKARRGFFPWRRNKAEKPIDNENRLPEHTTPDHLRTSYNTEATAVHPDAGAPNTLNHNKYGESGYGHDNTVPATTHDATTGTVDPYGRKQPAANYPYGDGVYDRRA
ncbi:hypothetical protein B0T11DRAFT_85468 [Plectosphaerella cucumerina]|jgi:hypothetical protein|uniref:MARVEL domain-containing protein n=1 Tax=Plectosphaerella cucumerina TaxID=40658 RepID=A0A8K0TLR6_9PEZI|nr:hypothetical protein B0T11DRAFT_85468 [Plectosphaerella cucumerina]